MSSFARFEIVWCCPMGLSSSALTYEQQVDVFITAAEEGNIHQIHTELLPQGGMWLNARGTCGYTALYGAMFKLREEMIDYLLNISGVGNVYRCKYNLTCFDIFAWLSDLIFFNFTY